MWSCRLGIARWAGHAAFAAERDKPAVAAVFTEEARDAKARDAALEEGPQGGLGAGMGQSVALSGALGQMRLKMIEDRPVERTGGGDARAIGGADRNGGHALLPSNPPNSSPSLQLRR